MNEHRQGVLDGLVADGVLTSTQASALAQVQGREDVQALLEEGVVTVDELKAVHEAMEAAGRPDRKAVAEEVLNSLVADGVITAEQASKILAAAPKGPQGGHVNGGRGPSGMDEGRGGNGQHTPGTGMGRR